MLKKLLIAVGVFAVTLMLALSYITARFIDKEEIMRTKIEMERLKASRDSILTVVAIRDSMQNLLQNQVSSLQVEANSLREQVALLEELRQSEQLSVRRLRRREDLQRRLQQTYPEMAHSDWGVTEVFNEEAGIGIEYLLIPLWFSETFIIEHQNSESYKRQRDKLVLVDSLQNTIVALKDSLFHLEREKSAAYKAGYDEAYARYDTLSQKYIKLLEKPPQVKFGFPSIPTIITSGALGVAAGVAISR
ncbi:MAG: hypothetical protein ACE5IW_10960 [bacterium]